MTTGGEVLDVIVTATVIAIATVAVLVEGMATAMEMAMVRLKGMDDLTSIEVEAIAILCPMGWVQANPDSTGYLRSWALVV